jgi:hypothetical protein
MALRPDEREHVISTAVDLLRHKRRDKLMALLEERIDRGDYPPGSSEEKLDRIALTIARTIDEQLTEGT